MNLTQRLAGLVVIGLVIAAVGAPSALAQSPSVVSGEAAAAPLVTALAAVQYQVEYRHPTETNNEWRVSVAWTTDYTYAKGTYDYLVGLQIYDVRMYKRGQ